MLVVAPVAPGTRAIPPPAADRLPPLLADDDKRDAEAGRRTEPSPANPIALPDPEGQAGPPPRHALAHHEPAPGETKRAALIRLYEQSGQVGDPRYGDRAKTAALASEIAGQIGYHPGTARRELARYLATQPQTGPRPVHEAEPGAEAVA